MIFDEAAYRNLKAFVHSDVGCHGLTDEELDDLVGKGHLSIYHRSTSDGGSIREPFIAEGRRHTLLDVDAFFIAEPSDFPVHRGDLTLTRMEHNVLEDVEIERDMDDVAVRIINSFVPRGLIITEDARLRLTERGRAALLRYQSEKGIT